MKPLASAEVIAVGSEMLGPDRLDTNSLAIGGIGCVRSASPLRAKSVVGDRPDDLAAHSPRRARRARIWIILIGGLGPTDDDVTRDVVASSLGSCHCRRTWRSDDAIRAALPAGAA